MKTSPVFDKPTRRKVMLIVGRVHVRVVHIGHARILELELGRQSVMVMMGRVVGQTLRFKQTLLLLPCRISVRIQLHTRQEDGIRRGGGGRSAGGRRSPSRRS